MQYLQTIRHWPICPFPRYPVRLLPFAIQQHSSITFRALCAHPHQALARFVTNKHFCEAFSKIFHGHIVYGAN